MVFAMPLPVIAYVRALQAAICRLRGCLCSIAGLVCLRAGIAFFLDRLNDTSIVVGGLLTSDLEEVLDVRWVTLISHLSQSVCPYVTHCIRMRSVSAW